MTPKIYDINEVTISTKSLVRKRRRNLRFFKNEFLGLTANARECEILNENDITFNYYADSDTLKAFAEEHIVLHYDTNKTFLKSTGSLRIYYNNRISSIAFLKGEVYFDKVGYFDPLGLVWEGDMARLRVADWLPYELSIEQ